MVVASSRRVAVVTGAAGSIGRGIVAMLAKAGFAIMLIGRTRQTLEAIVASTQGLDDSRVIIEVCDVRRAEDLERAASVANSRWGKIDVLCTAAGVMHVGALDEISEAIWHQLIDTNVLGTAMAIRAFLSLMPADARIVTIASTAGARPIPRFAAYSTTKAAIIHLTQAAALDYADRGIRVNCICLGAINPEFRDKEHEMEGAMLRDQLIAATPLGYLGTSTDVAHLVSFLVDRTSHWITGSVLVADGGLSLV